MSNKVAPTGDAELPREEVVSGQTNTSYDVTNESDDVTNDAVAYSKTKETDFNGHVTIDVGTKQDRAIPDKPYPGMNKEDLLRFSNTPFWNTFRMISVLLFVAVWLALLGTVIGLTIATPRCGERPTPDWWQKATIYQIFVRSFFDSGDDGIGDLKGIKEKLDYLKSLEIDAILLSSVFESQNTYPYPDHGYEVTNYTVIDPEYGTTDDLKSLIKEAHNRSISVLLDFIPNHTGTAHNWFIESRKSKTYDNEYWNYYVWAECSNISGNFIPPNNWKSVYGGSAWTYVPEREQCYLHQFFDTQPDLDLGSKAVKAELEGVLRFWLDEGVDGFMVSSSMYLFENTDLTNETQKIDCLNDEEYSCFDHTETTSLPEVYHMIKEWRKVVDQYNALNTSRPPRVLLTDGDVLLIQQAVDYYGSRGDGAQLPINYVLNRASTSECHNHRVMSDTEPLAAEGECVLDDVERFLSAIPVNTTACWLISDRDRSRTSTALTNTFINSIHMISLTLPGTSVIYYGNEIGMTDFNATRHGTSLDPDYADPRLSRDKYRTPMQWSADSNANFTQGANPWLEVNTNHDTINVQEQLNSTSSVLTIFRNLTTLRHKKESLQYGAIHYLHLPSQPDIVAFVREHEGFDRLLTVVNFGNKIITSMDLRKTSQTIDIPSKAKVELATFNTTAVKTGEDVDLTKVPVQPGQGFIASWAYTRP